MLAGSRRHQAEDSLATPTQMAVSSDGTTLYVAALGSDKIGIIDTGELETDNLTPDAADHITVEWRRARPAWYCTATGTSMC